MLPECTKRASGGTRENLRFDVFLYGGPDYMYYMASQDGAFGFRGGGCTVSGLIRANEERRAGLMVHGVELRVKS